MKIDKYYQLLMDGKSDEAKQIRLESIPDKLIKFIWLDGSENDEKKFLSLGNNEIWFSQKDVLNDPYEYKGILLDEKKLEAAGLSKETIDFYQKIFDFSDYAITCFSSNPIDYIPMWAYYTNNHKGFCVEYDVIKKYAIHEVLYEPERIKVASLLFQSREAIKKAIITGEQKEAEFYSTLFLQNLFVKSKSWEHEHEYRMVYPIDKGVGVNVPISKLGLKVSRIVAGINCLPENISRLNEISNRLKLGNVYISNVHSEKYTIEITR